MNFATLKQAGKVLELITQNEVSSDQMQYLLSSGLLAELFRSNIRNISREKFCHLVGSGKLFPDITELSGIILPAPELSLEARVQSGHYHFFNTDMKTEYFPFTLPSGPRDLVLAHFKKTMSRDHVEIWAKENGYECARIEDLLAVGAHPKYGKLQLKFEILAFGSFSKHDTMSNLRMTPRLYSKVNRKKRRERCLSAWRYDEECFRPDDRFLLVHKAK